MGRSGVHGMNTAKATTDQRFGLLDEGQNKKGVWVYGQAQGALDQYEAVKVDNDGQLIPLTSTVSGTEPTAVGFPQVAAADDEYVWVWVGEGGGDGEGIYGLVDDSITAGAAMTTTATAGVIGAGGDTISGLTTVDTTAGSGGPHATELYSPLRLSTN